MSAGGSTNPLRQQMINMMYLVLTALLALNVSADILKAFALVNKGLDNTNVNYEQKNAITMAQFEDLVKVDKGAATKYYNNALNAQSASEKVFNDLERLKDQIAQRSGGWVPGTGKATVDDDKNLEVSTRYFLKEGHGLELQNNLKAYIQTMKSYLDNPNDLAIHVDVADPPTNKEGDKKNWMEYYWEGVPSIAAITELTKMQNDVRNAETEVTNYNIAKVGVVKYKFDNLVPVVSTETPVLTAGQNYEAKIFLGAVSSTMIPKIKVDGIEQKVVNGSVDYTEPATGGGTKSLNVSITVPDPKHPGKDTTYTTKTEYTVYTGASTVSASKMNMLYIGLDNPIDVSAAGFTPAQTFVKFSGGGALKQTSPGHYSFNPDGSQRDVTASCYVKMADGSTRQMGQALQYRIRKVPKPEILLGTKAGGPISKGEVLIVERVSAGFGEAFAYAGMPVTVHSYRLIINHNGKLDINPVTGNIIPANVKEKLKNVHSGDMIFLTDVEVTAQGLKATLGSTYTVR